MMKRNDKRCRGFSLVELSIVLVILGLLVGGILAGQSLIRASQLRSVASDFSKYQTAYLNFRTKYDSLPGDMDNATKYWGIAGGDGNNSACMDTVVTGGTATCNGNGDGAILTRVNYLDETNRAWQHLANAGFVEGSYVGTNKNFTAEEHLSQSVPRSRVANTGFMMLAASRAAIFWTDGSTHNENHIRFGSVVAPSDGYNVRIGSAALTPQETWNIDTKLDDGRPGSGQMLVHRSGSMAACTTTAFVGTSEYPLTVTTNVCLPQLML